MFIVEITYRTRLGGLMAQMSTSQILATRAEAEEVRDKLRLGTGWAQQLADAKIVIKNALPPPTVDDALEAFRKNFAEYRPE